MSRSRASNTINPDILVRIGTMNPAQIGNRSGEHVIPVDISDGKGGCDTLVEGFKVFNRTFVGDKALEHLKTLSPLKLEISRTKPEITIKKSAGYDSKDADRVLDFFRRHVNFIDLNNPAQYDPFSEMPVQGSPKANASFFIEDMRQTRVAKVSTKKEMMEILRLIDKNETNEKWLRDALFMIGESPVKEDTVEEMYAALADLVIDNPKSEQRRKFVEVYLSGKSDDKVLETEKWFNKAVSMGIVQFREGMFCYNLNKLGSTEKDSVSQLMFDHDVFRSLKVAVSEKSDLPEDKQVMEKEAAKANGSADELRAIAWVSDKLKSSGLSGNPARTLNSVSTLGDAVSKYNELAQKAELPKSEFLTEQKVLSAIEA